ncbi:MAG: trypsin-like peptidase domain-containing protein [Bacilli bacterium]
MKKIVRLFIIMMISLLTLTGCQNLITNEIYNKSYQVEDISLEEFEDLVVSVVEKTSPAVLGITNYTSGGITGVYSVCCTGSGVIYRGVAHMKNGSEAALIDTLDSTDVEYYEYFFVTNRHVVLNDNNQIADKIEVYFGDTDIAIEATIIQFDPQVDLAVGTFNHSKYIQPLDFADSDQLKAGNFAIAIGSPSGHDYYGSVTFGIISFPKRYIAEANSAGVSEWDAEYVQHDVAINPGNSGGPLISMAGEIIGINTMKFVSDDIDNMGFSIPSNLVGTIVALLEQGLQPSRAKLGIMGREIRGFATQDRLEYDVPSDLAYGIYVEEVTAGGVAENANLRSGDIILTFDGVEIRYSYQIRAILNNFVIGSGQTTVITVYRNSEILTIPITF